MKTKNNNLPKLRPIFKDEYSAIIRVSYSPTEADYEVHIQGSFFALADTEEEAFSKRDAAVAELLQPKAA